MEKNQNQKNQNQNDQKAPTLSDILDGLIKIKGVTKRKLCKELGLMNFTSFSTKLAKNVWSIADLITIMETLGGNVILKIDGVEIPITSENVSETQMGRRKPKKKKASQKSQVNI